MTNARSAVLPVYARQSQSRSWVDGKAINVKDGDKHFLPVCRTRGAYWQE